MNETVETTELEEVLARSLLWRALSLAFQPVSQDAVKALRDTAGSSALRIAAHLLDPVHRKDGSDLPRLVDAWLETFHSLSEDSLRRSQARLFGHTVRGPVCPYEAEYGQDGLFQQPQHLASLNGFYRAFGLRVGRDPRERPDHIGAELEFMDFLCRKQAFARQQEDAEMEEVARQAGRLFLKEHLGRFGRAFASKVTRGDREGFLGRAASLMFELITRECDRLGLEAGPSKLRLRPVAEDKVPMACAGEAPLVELET